MPRKGQYGNSILTNMKSVNPTNPNLNSPGASPEMLRLAPYQLPANDPSRPEPRAYHQRMGVTCRICMQVRNGWQ